MSTLERDFESVLGNDGAQIRHVQGGSRGLKLQFRCLSGFRDAVTVYLTKRTYNVYLGWLEKQTLYNGKLEPKTGSFHQISNPKLMDGKVVTLTNTPRGSRVYYTDLVFSGLIYWHNSLV